MSRRSLIILVVLVVAVSGALFGFVQIDRANFGIPRFYVWRTLSGQFHGGQRAQVDGVSIYYETYGEGPPVLVLHGAGAFLETMHPFIHALASTHTVIAVDSRGQGRSTDAPGPIRYDLMAGDMLALMDHLHIKRADVVGWSDGGIIGLAMAMKRPDRIDKLMAIGANFDVKGIDPKAFDPAQFKQEAAQVEPFYDAIAPDPRHFQTMLSKITTLVTTEPHYTVPQLSRIRAKVLVVAGEHDMILRAHTDALAKAIPGAREVIVPGASHFGPLEQPQVYGAMAVQFLNAP
ncbi:MAG TPA: alpha/beta fold hydrolase [Rhizomicrobium sp.]|jgi:pimeloyl-ACP methyl ester carboxylesterase|nr:alpha/beta fold hydrolase [Rhizomicrobium sp.]